MKNPNKKILISLSIACVLGLFAYLSPTLAKVINFGTGSDTAYFPGNIGIGATTTDKLNISGTLRVTGTTTLTSLTSAGNQCLYVDSSGIIRGLGSQCGSATGGDNLGNHTATQALNLGANALVGNGGSTGITISSGGAVSIANGLTLTSGTLSLPGSSVTDAMVSDTLTASNLVAGSAVVSDAEVDNNISIVSGTIGSNNISSASTWTTLGTLTIGDNGDAVLMSATNWDVDSSGNIFANGGFSTYDTTVTDNYIEAGGFCMGNGTNCITSWTNAGGNVNASSPTANYVTKFSDSDTIANSTIFDNGSGVGIGTTAVSSARLVISGSGTYNIDAGSKPITNIGVGSEPTDSVNRNYVDTAVAGVSGGGGYWLTTGSGIYATTSMTSVGIGTTSPAAPFEVYGGFYMGGGSGDVNADGYVNSNDGLLASRFAHGLTSLTPLQQAMADVDGDGMVTDFDAKNILKRFVSIYGSRDQMNAESRRIKSLAINYDGSGNVMLGYTEYSNEVYMPDRLTVYGSVALDGTGNLKMNGAYINYNSTSSVGLKFDSSNNALFEGNSVGIGTTNPGALLEISTTGTANNLKLNSTSNGVSGLSVATDGTIKGYWALARSAGQYFSDAAAGDMAFRSESNKILFGQGSGASTMTINAGNVGIGTTNPTQKLQVVGNIQVTSGSVTADAFYYNSDRTLKKDIKPISGALSKVLNLQGVSFKWRDTGEANYGFIAQDVEKVLPELVETGDNGKKSVAYGNFTAILVEALKTQQKEIDSLQARVKALESSAK